MIKFNKIILNNEIVIVNELILKTLVSFNSYN